MSGCSAVKAPTVDPHPFDKTLRRDGAHSAILGAIGWKQSDGLGFERQATPAWQFDVFNASSLEINQSVEAGLKELKVSVKDLADIAAKSGYTSTKQYRLTTLQIREPLRLAREVDGAIKNDAQVRGLLSNPSTRIVTSIVTIADSKLADAVSANLGVKGTGKTGSGPLAVSFDFGGGSKYELKIADGAVVLYALSRLCWDADGNLVTLKVDGPKADDCPTGFKSARPATK